MSAEPIVGLDGVGTIPEEVGEVIETPEYSNRKLLAPGKYTNPFRTVAVSDKRVDKNGNPYRSFALTLAGGIVDEFGYVHLDRYPMKDWVTTILFAKEGQPGKTSSAALLVRMLGGDPKALGSEQIGDFLQETASTPVGVRIGRTERAEVVGTDPNTGKKLYAKTRTYTRHWNVGTKDAPIWAAEIDFEGRHLIGKESIEGYFKVI